MCDCSHSLEIYLFCLFSGKGVEKSKQHKEDHNAGKKGSIINGEKDVNLNTESVEEKEDEKKEDQYVVFVQDVGFTIKITAPGVEPFDIQVNDYITHF
jgi:protein TIF31